MHCRAFAMTNGGYDTVSSREWQNYWLYRVAFKKYPLCWIRL